MDYAVASFQRAGLLPRHREASRGSKYPERATWIRMMMCELNRMSFASPLHGHQRHGPRRGVGMMIYGWREREEVLRFFEKVTGLRMNHNYIRPGGVAADLPRRLAGRQWPTFLEISSRIAARGVRHPHDRPAHLARTYCKGMGVITADEAIALGATGPILRATGYAWDLRRDDALSRLRSRSTSTWWSGPTATASIATPSASTRSASRCASSARFIEKHAHPATTGCRTARSPLRPEARIDESMEALIHHFKIFTEGFQVPAGDAYSGGGVAPRGARLLHRQRWQRQVSYYACTSAAPASRTSRPCPT